MAILMLGEDIWKTERLETCEIPDSVRTIYIADIRYPLHLSFQEMQNLQPRPGRGGPLVGHNFAFADLDASHPYWETSGGKSNPYDIKNGRRADFHGRRGPFIDKPYRWVSGLNFRRRWSWPQIPPLHVDQLCAISLLPDETP